MDEKDKKARKDGPPAGQDRPAEDRTRLGSRPADRTVFRNNDAKAPAAGRQPANPSAVPPNDGTRNDATKIRGGSAARGPAAPADATRVRPGTPPHGAVAADAQANQTRVRPGAGVRGGAPPNTPKLEQHQVLKGRFTLEKVIGVGGMGVVYKASDRLKVEAHDREPYVAIKVLSEEFKAHPESFVALQRESRKTQRMAHPNVVKVFDFDRDGDIVFMTMEYMEGRSLDQIISQYGATGLPQNEVWNITHGLCSALIHAHEENIVHSDFKPGNIFITTAGMPKIFDFGIARAVAVVDRQSSGTRDVTVFDAGSLGALTPAYASMEMLLGKEPDVRDDLYALGCIVYEMLTGEHPFDRLPADEAWKRGLRPKKINTIKRRQWKALEKALAFKREDRAHSVAEFYEGILAKTKPSYVLAASILIVAIIASATYLIVTNRPSPERQTEIQLSEIEFGIRYNLFKEKIQKLIADPQFTDAWEASIFEEVSGMKALLKDRSDEWFPTAVQQIYELYVGVYKQSIAKKEYARASALLTNAYRYATDTEYLDGEKIRLAELLREEELRKKALAEQRGQAATAQQAESADQKARTSIFDLALKNVNQQLRCDGRLNMRDLGVAVEKLRSVDRGRYNSLEPNIVAALAQCIVSIGKAQPEAATEAKNYARRLFPNNALIAGIEIIPRDACSKSLAGLGARDAAVCRDKMQGGGAGPAMVVIPGAGAIQTFAMGKYEVSAREINQFCNATKSCQPVAGADEGVPATNISADTATGYVRWLSRLTGQKYRLPTRAEWTHAAKANGLAHDPNRNCAFSTRGIEKGKQLVRVNVGVQNGWGLVNYLGNSQEWVYDRNRSLVAVGGSFEDAMERCNVDSAAPHAGGADSKTGFRIAREIVQ